MDHAHQNRQCQDGAPSGGVGGSSGGRSSNKGRRLGKRPAPVLPPPPEGAEVMSTPEAMAFLGITFSTWRAWRQSGRLDIPRFRHTWETGTFMYYLADDIRRVAEEVRREKEPFPDRDRPGCYLVPLRTRKGILHAIIDEEDLPKVAGKTWNFVKVKGDHAMSTVVRTGNNGVPHTPLKRVILGVENEGNRTLVVHANGDALDCRRCNLVVQTPSERTRRGFKFKHRQGRPTTSRFKGVYWNEREGKWIAQIGVNNRPVKLGSFDCEEDAAEAYDEGARKYFGAEARLNFPGPGELSSALELKPALPSVMRRAA